MSKVITLVAVLIGIFLFLIYYRGATADISAGGNALDRLLLFLQGRDANGNITNYPR